MEKNNLFEIEFFQEYLHGFFKKIETFNKTGYYKMNVILRFSFSICSRRRTIFYGSTCGVGQVPISNTM